uniref:Elongator complex protein 2 n=1 Tax=Ascaris lumbricoides TaxID=6252 RepID=A0A0M3IHR1_ASCLU
MRVLTLHGHTDWISSIAIKGDGCAVEVSVRLEAVLGGHDAWVHSLQWHSIRNQLLSVSSDKCLILWEPSEMGGGVWLEKVRVGDVGGQAVGYYGGCYSPAGTMIIAHSYFGGFYAWSCKQLQLQAFLINRPNILFAKFVILCYLYLNAFKGSKHSYAEIARPQVHGYDLACIASVST